MAASFSLDEKRFVLAEMIKCSSVDVDMLIRFVESNVSDPNWMIMQIPPGRNLEQCMQVANRSPTAPNHRSAMSQNDHLANSGMNHPRQIAPRTSPGGQTPGVMPMSPVNMAPWPPADVAEDRRAPPYEAPNAPAPRKRGRPSRVDRNTAVPPRLANIAPRPPQPVPGSNTPRPILPAIQRQADTRSSQPPPPAHVPLLLDSPPSKKKRKTSAGAVSVSTPPPPPSVTTPPASVDHEKRPRESSEANSINGRENIREMGQVQSPRPMPLEPEPRHHPTLMPVASAAPSQIKA
ncbi:hypothetical protein FP744_10003215 [Trichoderma asperellum]|nr:hypothetical protein LI328DRAFT_90961 [Trichoderma asperelloides]